MASWTKAITDPLKAASDLAQGMMDLRDTVKLGSVVIKLNAEILAAQRGALAASQSEAEMVEEIRALKAQVVSFETWETEKKRYQLHELPPGVFVYTLKQDMAGDEPMHHICQTCYQHGKKSILHATEPTNGMHHLNCKACGADLRVGHFSAPALARGPRGGSWQSR